MDNWANLLQGSAILLIVAMAMTLIVSAGAIDLSVGVALDFGAAFALVALKTRHLPWQAAVGCALLGGVLIGLLNAFLILICRIRPSSPRSAPGLSPAAPSASIPTAAAR